MRKVVVTEFVSLDGVMEEPAWTVPYWNDDIARFKGDEQDTSDALLLGRVTYEGFAAAWPDSPDEGAEYMNNVLKYVVTTTLDKAAWSNSVLINDDIIAEITKLKRQDGKDILVYGSATLVQTLMQHDLVDLYRLLVYPVVLGKGRRLFGAGTTATLALLEARSLGSGVVALVYVDIGEVDDLLIDKQEHKVRFIQVASGGFLGLGAKHFLVPVDAISHIDDTTVFVDQPHSHVVGAPAYDPEVVPERPYCEGLYRHYGYSPYWQEGYR